MANKGTSRMRANILLDTIKSKMNGHLTAIPKDIGDKWVYAEVSVNSSGDLLTTGNDFLESGAPLATDDTVEWIAIKNTSTTATEGICICLDGGTAAFDLPDGIFIGAGEMICLKINKVTLANLHAASITMNEFYGYTTSASSTAVTVQVAAIIDDTSYVP